MPSKSASLEALIPNGVDGTNGGYFHPPVPVAEIARVALEGDGAGWPVHTRGLPPGVDPRDLARTGWGVVFSRQASQEVRDALSPLIEHRRSQAGDRCLKLDYQPGETKEQFLLRYFGGPGPVDVDAGQIPYYLLFVGGPEEIPYSLQYQLDIQYAVGRLGFETAEEYARYARNVVACERERQRPSRDRRATLFSTRHPDDLMTQMAVDRLSRPLAGRLSVRHSGWTIATFFGEEATKERLGRLLGGPETPDLLLTAGHGLAFASVDPRQLRQQGALVCHGWPGPEKGRGKPIPPEHFFAGGDLSSAGGLHGLICFHLACFSAGTPRMGSSTRLLERRPLAPQDFLAELPRRLLAHPRGGALAVIGHVDTVWEPSLLWQRTASQVPVFESALSALVDGLPVGEAMKVFGERYGEIAADLVECRERREWGEKCDDEEIAALWLASQDARSYVVLGDPAVRLAV